MGRWKIKNTSGSYIDIETTHNIRVMSVSGTGMPPVNNVSQPYGLVDGAQFQRTIVPGRVITLNCATLTTTMANYHTARQGLIDLVKRDRGASSSPLTLRYDDGSTQLDIECYYDGGLEMAASYYQEKFPLRFVAVSPFWSEDTNSSASLALSASATVNSHLRKTAAAVWSGLGTVGAGNSIEMIYENETDLYMGGNMSSFNGSTVNNIARYDKAASTWHKMGGSSVGMNNKPLAAAEDGAGKIYFGGTFTTAGGTTVNRICYYLKSTNSFYKVGSGSTAGANGDVNAIIVDDDDNMFMGGGFTQVEGVSQFNYLGKWTGTAWSKLSISSGSLNGANGTVFGMGRAGDTLVIAGGFSTAGGSTMDKITKYSITNDTFSVIQNSFFSTNVYGVLVQDSATYYFGATTSPLVTKWDGSELIDLGIHQSGAIVYELAYDTNEGLLYAGGTFTTAGTGSNLKTLAVYDGAHWRPSELVLNSLPILSMYNYRGILMLGFSTTGSAALPSATTVTNNGTATAYPTIKLTGAGSVFGLTNVDSGQSLQFRNLTLSASETLTIDLTPGVKSVSTNFRSDAIRYVSLNSELTTFGLIPGSNSIYLSAASDLTSSSILWDDRHWSIDGVAS